MNYVRCCLDRLPPIRAELLEADELLSATNDHFAYAVCRTFDGCAREVNVRTRNILFALERFFADHEAATAAGEAWLQEQGAQR